MVSQIDHEQYNFSKTVAIPKICALTLVFCWSYTNDLEVLIQLCKGFANEQIETTMTLKFVAMATTKVVKDALVLRLITYKLLGERFCF